MTNNIIPGIRLWLRRLIKVAILASVVAGGIYWVRFRPVAVVEYKIERGPIVTEVMGTGTLEARIKATVSPKISGRIEAVLVDQGDAVVAGQLLIRLDDSQLTQQVAIAAADIETKQAGINRLESDIARAAAVLAAAQSNHDRLRSLVQKNAISQEELDKSVEALAIAVSEASRADAALAEGQKALLVARRTFDFQETRLGDARITAPFDGLIIRRDRDPGDVVVPSSSVLTLISMDELWVNAWVDETEMANLRTGQFARAIFRSESTRMLHGKVVRLAKETDRETREFIVDVEVLELPENWAVGQRAEVYIETSRKTNVVLLPSRFLGRTGDESGVFVDRDGHVAWQPVTVGLVGRNQVEIVEGLEPGQTVVQAVSPDKPLRSGQRVASQ